MLPRILIVVALSVLTVAAGAEPLSIVAAENFYGDVAGQLAGPGVNVTSILSNPEADPHLFEASPSTARALRGARIVVANGAGYDPWMTRLLHATRSPGRAEIVVADLLGRKPGENPHLWYDPATMPAVAKALSDALAQADPPHAAAYAGRLAAFQDALKPLAEKVAAMRQRFAGQTVTATEPVFGPMAAALGLDVRNARFQLAVQNDAEPRPSDVAAFEADLRGKVVRVLLYNSQATGRIAQRMVAVAKQAGIPVVGVTETEPAGTTYQAWMLGQLEALEHALGP